MADRIDDLRAALAALERREGRLRWRVATGLSSGLLGLFSLAYAFVTGDVVGLITGVPGLGFWAYEARTIVADVLELDRLRERQAEIAARIGRLEGAADGGDDRPPL